jgi:hypothetical protein
MVVKKYHSKKTPPTKGGDNGGGMNDSDLTLTPSLARKRERGIFLIFPASGGIRG